MTLVRGSPQGFHTSMDFSLGRWEHFFGWTSSWFFKRPWKVGSPMFPNPCLCNIFLVINGKLWINIYRRYLWLKVIGPLTCVLIGTLEENKHTQRSTICQCLATGLPRLSYCWSCPFIVLLVSNFTLTLQL